MASKFTKSTSHIFLTIFVGFIAVSFMFTGYETSMGTPSTVARVGNIDISIRDYQQEYNRQLEFYRQIFGEDLSSAQIENFGIKQQAIQNLVQQKLMIHFARDVGVAPGEQAIRDEILQLPYFQTGGQFNIEQYRQLLAANGLTPKEFEEMISNELQINMARGLIQNIPISAKYIQEREELKSRQREIMFISAQRNDIRDQLEVTTSEIQQFLENERNINQVEMLFSQRRSSLDRPAQAKASHILITHGPELPRDEDVQAKIMEIKERVTIQNFAELAKEYSQDPGSQSDGGSLGWFSAGQMVPEFEEAAFNNEIGSIIGPIETQFGLHLLLIEDKREAVVAQLDDYKEEIAKELIRANREDEVTEILTQLRSQLYQLMSENNTRELTRVSQRYGLQFQEALKIGPLDRLDNGLMLAPGDIQSIFQKEIGSTLTLGEHDHISFVTIKREVEVDRSDVDLDRERNNLRNVLSQKLNEAVMTTLQDKVSIRIWENRVF